MSCKATSSSDFLNLDTAMSALQNFSLYTIDTTCKALKANSASKKEQTNMLFGLDLVKMATIHINVVSLTYFKLRL